MVEYWGDPAYKSRHQPFRYHYWVETVNTNVWHGTTKGDCQILCACKCETPCRNNDELSVSILRIRYHNLSRANYRTENIPSGRI